MPGHLCRSQLVCAVLPHGEHQAPASEVYLSHRRVSGDDSNETVKSFHPTHVFSLQPYNQDISWHLGSIAGRCGEGVLVVVEEREPD